MNFFDHVDSIFIDNQVDSVKLKEFLELIATLITTKPQQESVPTKEASINYLEELIAKCEKRLEKLTETQKTKVVIRNEGRKLESIIESIENLKKTNATLQTQVDKNARTLTQLKKRQCDEKPSETFQDIADCFRRESMRSDVCNLKRKYCEIGNQVNELAMKFNLLKTQVESIADEIVCLKRIPLIEENVCKLLDWRASLREDIELMTERYEHVKVVKISKADVEEMIENKVNYNHLARYVSQVTFNLAREDFSKEFEELKEYFCELQLHLTSKLVELHRDVQQLFKNLYSKRRLEKRSFK